jgi:hypothetical protein
MSEVEPGPGGSSTVAALRGIARVLGWGGAPAGAAVVVLIYDGSVVDRLGLWVVAVLVGAMLWWVLLVVASSLRD